ncbi:hypothetical protein P4S64_18155 [Vibrio sp. M60_M31a]
MTGEKFNALGVTQYGPDDGWLVHVHRSTRYRTWHHKCGNEHFRRFWKKVKALKIKITLTAGLGGIDTVRKAKAGNIAKLYYCVCRSEPESGD